MRDMTRSRSQAPDSGWITFLAHLLFVLAAWSVFIKYVFPITFALFTDEAWTAHIFWDLWPVAHVWLGWALLTQPWYTRWLAAGMSVIEIVDHPDPVHALSGRAGMVHLEDQLVRQQGLRALRLRTDSGYGGRKT
jgi:hypothetical protein